MAEARRTIAAEIGKRIVGQDAVIDHLLIALFARGHCLFVGVPGLAKTLLIQTLSEVLALSFGRIQFTPDLMPSDIMGTNIINEAPDGQRVFSFQPGPLFAQIVLADEINRATPRTQSALLEAMSERQVSLDGVTRPLGPPFVVMATQNPFEFEGTYPLPESQLDRFLMRLSIGYPPRAAEKRILAEHRAGEPVDTLQPVLSPENIQALQHTVREIRFDDRLQDYLLNIVEATRASPQVHIGASTRAGLGLYRAAQAHALLDGRDYVVPDDVKQLAGPVLGHRLLMKSMRPTDGRTSAEVFLSEELQRLPVPS